MRAIQRPTVAQALFSFFGIKGDNPMTVDGGIIPTINIADLTETPSLRYGIPVGVKKFGANVAAMQTGIAIMPGPGVALQILRIDFINTGAGVLTGSVIFATNAQWTAYTTQGSAVNMFDLSSGADAIPVPAQRGSLLKVINDAAPGGSASIHDFNVAAATTEVFVPPSPGITLYGNDSGGIPALVALNSTVAQDLTIQVYGKEWPLPGL